MKNSAYRSGLIVKEYKASFKKKYGKGASPYIEKGNKNKDSGLERWFDEEWTNEEGGIGYDDDNTLYRPSKRVNAGTPATWAELTKEEIAAAKKQKKRRGKVRRFKKRQELETLKLHARNSESLETKRYFNTTLQLLKANVDVSHRLVRMKLKFNLL